MEKTVVFQDKEVLLLPQDIPPLKILARYWYCLIQCKVTDKNQLCSVLCWGSSLKRVQRIIKEQAGVGYGIKI